MSSLKTLKGDNCGGVGARLMLWKQSFSVYPADCGPFEAWFRTITTHVDGCGRGKQRLFKGLFRKYGERVKSDTLSSDRGRLFQRDKAVLVNRLETKRHTLPQYMESAAAAISSKSFFTQAQGIWDWDHLPLPRKT